MDTSALSQGFTAGRKVDIEDFKKRFNALTLPGEEARGVFGGAVIAGDGHASCGTGPHYLVVTTKRVIFSAGPDTATTTDAYAYEDISGAEAKKGLILADVIVTAKGAKKQFGFMEKPEADKAVELIQEHLVP